MGLNVLIMSGKIPAVFEVKPLPDNPALALAEARKVLSIESLATTLGRGTSTIRRWLRDRRPDPLIVPALRTRLEANGAGLPNPQFTFIDLFAGIGGLRKAFESHGGQCVWTSEWDRFSVQTYKANFPDRHEIAGDIQRVEADQIPEHDVLLAGFPCQPFSLAGVSKKNSLGRDHGFRDLTQGTLFFDVARIIDFWKPKAFLLENVKNLTSHDRGRTFEIIRRTLEDELGYRIHVKILDAIHWLPQHRERVAIVGFRESVQFTWNDLRLPPTGPTLASILHHPSEPVEAPYTKAKRGRTIVGDQYTLSDHLWKYLQDYAAKHAAKGNGFGCSVVGPDDTSRTLSARYHKDGSEILVSQGSKKNPRRLTPRECARLMGFDEPGSPPVLIPVSDTQAYRQFGNAVAVPVFREVARIVVPHLPGIRAASANDRSKSTARPNAFQPELSLRLS